MYLGNDYDINLALTDIEQYILDTNPFLDLLSPVYIKEAPLVVFLLANPNLTNFECLF